MLERLGYNVSALSNSLEALETFNSNPDGYDLVISEYDYARHDRRSTCTRINDHPTEYPGYHLYRIQ